MNRKKIRKFIISVLLCSFLFCNLIIFLVCLTVESEAMIGVAKKRIHYDSFLEYGLLYRGLPHWEYNLSNLWIFLYDLYISMKPLDRAPTWKSQYRSISEPLKRLGLESNDYTLLYKIGIKYEHEKKDNEAIQMYLKSIEATQNREKKDAQQYPCPHQGVGMLFFEKGDFDKARGALEEAIRREQFHRGRKPGLWIAQYSLAEVYLNERRYDEALALVEAAKSHPHVLNSRKSQAQGLILQGQIYNAMKDYEKAEKSFLESIQVIPKLTYEPFLGLGWVMDNQRRYEEALAYYRKALEIKRDHARIYEGIANAYNGLNRPEESRSHYEKALEHDPVSEHAMTELGLYHLQRGEDPEAEALFNRALEINPDRYTCVHEGLGLLLLKKGEIEEAEKEFRTAIHINPDIEFRKYNGLGRIHLERGEMEKARTLFEKSLENYPWPENEAHRFLSMTRHPKEAK